MIFRTLAALCCSLSLSACDSLGEPLSRSLRGLLTETNVAPRGVAYLVPAVGNMSSFDLGGLNYWNTPLFARFTILPEGANFRIVSDGGFFELPPHYISDTRTLYDIPGQNERYLLEFNQSTSEGRQIRATLVERRCQGETCLLAIASSVRVGERPDQVFVPLASECPNGDCEDIPLDAAAFANAAPEIARLATDRDLERYFLIYHDAARAPQ